MGQSRWQIAATRKAEKNLKKLDRPVLRRVRKYMDEVADLQNPRSRGKPMTANKAGLWGYRIGDYRMICDIQDEKLIIVALDFDHRSEIY